jgi:hypothetical protein
MDLINTKGTEGARLASEKARLENIKLVNDNAYRFQQTELLKAEVVNEKVGGGSRSGSNNERDGRTLVDSFIKATNRANSDGDAPPNFESFVKQIKLLKLNKDLEKEYIDSVR